MDKSYTDTGEWGKKDASWWHPRWKGEERMRHHR